MTLPLIHSTQQALETAYFCANGDRALADGPIALADLYQPDESNHIGDSLLTFLLNELVFDFVSDSITEEEYAASVQSRLDAVMREVQAVYLALFMHLSSVDVRATPTTEKEHGCA